MQKNHYKTVIVGGGIVGAGIFRDLALHGIDCLLIEKKDFSSQTSERSSKMLHGGIRYLENMDFSLVFEALHEKNLWIKLLPHLTHESSFFLPVFSDSKRPVWMIKIGLILYDFLSSFENTPHKIKNAAEVAQTIPFLKRKGLKGAGVYFDGVMDDAKITLEVIYDALKQNCAQAMSYTEVLSVSRQGDQNILHCKNTLNGEFFDLSAENVIYALGPFTDRFLKAIPMYNWKDILLPSKGSHLWISAKDLPLTNPIVITTKDDRVIFVIPHGDVILVGTTEVAVHEDFFDVTPSESEINYLLHALNDYFPSLNLGKNNILSTFAGIRPLVKDDSSTERGKTSREHKIYQPLSNTYVITGGKYTTFRVMGQDITRDICHKYGRSYNADLTKRPLRQKSVVLPFDWKIPTESDLVKICQEEGPKTFEDLVLRRLSISSRKIWKLRAPGVDFDNYFLGHLDLLKKYIIVDEAIIRNIYKHDC